jgi:predicted N-acetyltransferase YhbS
MDAVTAVLAAAFPTREEARLVQDLRAAGSLELALVSEERPAFAALG